MEQVMWFFADENKKVVAQALKAINEKKQAIDELSLKVEKGSYVLGYFKSDGTQKVFGNVEHIVS